MSPMRDGQTREDRATSTQPLDCWKAEFRNNILGKILLWMKIKPVSSVCSILLHQEPHSCQSRRSLSLVPSQMWLVFNLLKTFYWLNLWSSFILDNRYSSPISSLRHVSNLSMIFWLVSNSHLFWQQRVQTKAVGDFNRQQDSHGDLWGFIHQVET